MSQPSIRRCTSTRSRRSWRRPSECSRTDRCRRPAPSGRNPSHFPSRSPSYSPRHFRSCSPSYSPKHLRSCSPSCFQGDCPSCFPTHSRSQSPSCFRSCSPCCSPRHLPSHPQSYYSPSLRRSLLAIRSPSPRHRRNPGSRGAPHPPGRDPSRSPRESSSPRARVGEPRPRTMPSPASFDERTKPPSWLAG